MSRDNKPYKIIDIQWNVQLNNSDRPCKSLPGYKDSSKVPLTARACAQGVMGYLYD